MPKYDLAVIGAGLAGLSAAALASRSNKKIIVIEPGDTVGGVLQSCNNRGFSFYPGPSLSFGLERGGPLQQLNESLGIAQNATLQSPCYQVALPDRRITVYAEQSETLDELRREFPDEIDRIARFYNEIRKRSLMNAKNAVSKFLSSHKTASRFIGSYSFSREFTAFLDVQSYYFFSRPAASLRQTSLITQLDSAPSTLEGGFRGLADRILGVMLRNGVEIRYRTPIENISLKRGELVLRDQSIHFKRLLLNTGSHGGASYLFSGIHEEAIPVGMLPDVLCVPDYNCPERFFSLSISRPDDKAAPSGMRTLSCCFHNSAGLSMDERKKQVSELVPFLDDFTEFRYEYQSCQNDAGFDLKKITFKPVRNGDNDTLLRSSMKDIFMIADTTGAPPCRSISAAHQFMRYLK